MFQSTTKGARALAEGVPKVCVLITDGSSNSATKTIASGLRLVENKINLFAIGAGSVKESELIAIASKPVDQHFFKLDSVSTTYES